VFPRAVTRGHPPQRDSRDAAGSPPMASRTASKKMADRQHDQARAGAASMDRQWDSPRPERPGARRRCCHSIATSNGLTAPLGKLQRLQKTRLGRPVHFCLLSPLDLSVTVPR